MASAIYVPSLPELSRIFNAGFGEVQLTLSVYLVVFALATLVHGPLSDRLGRRVVMVGGLLICIFASIACSLAPSIEILILARAFQALGACAGMVVARAVIRDMYGPEGSARAITVVAMGVTLSPALAPILGGFLHVRFGWWASFDFVAAFTALMLLIVWFRLPETNRHRTARGGVALQMLTSFRQLLASRHFTAYGVLIAFASSGFYGFSAGAPIHLIQNLHIPPDHYGLYAAFPSFGFILGSTVTGQVLKRGGNPDRLISAGTLVLAVAGIAIALAPRLAPETALGLMLPMILYGFGNGLVMPNSFAGSMRYFPQIAGAASALAGFLQQAAGALATASLSLSPQTDSLGLTAQIAISGIGAAVVWWWLHGGRLKSPQPPSD